MKENKDIEKILLNDSAYEKMVKTKIEREFKKELELAKKCAIKLLQILKKFRKKNFLQNQQRMKLSIKTVKQNLI